MQCYAELTPPTAVTHAVNLPFLSHKSNNLVVAKTSLIQVFELKTIVTEASNSARNGASVGATTYNSESGDLLLQRTEQTSKLHLIGEYPVSGTITSIARIKTVDTKSGGESLLIAFRAAKLSLVEWDPEFYTISAISIHYYEGEDMHNCPWAPDIQNYVNHLTADPSSRCAAFQFGASNLAILPFHQAGDELVEGEYDPGLDDEPGQPSQKGTQNANGVENGTVKAPYASSFVLPMTALDPSLTHPIHLAFLYEYREPTFGILSSSKAPSLSLLHERKDVINYTVFTLDLEQRASTTLLSVHGLPFDLTKVVPLPLPVGGALLVGSNQIVHVDQAGKTHAVAVNEFARQCSSFSMSDQSDLALKLEYCQVEQVSSDTGDILIVLNTGNLALLSFKLDGRSISGMEVKMVSADHGGDLAPCGASSMANMGRGRLFIGSEDADSILLGWTSKSTQLTRKRSQVEFSAEQDEDLSFDEADLDDMDDDLYGTGASAVKQAGVSFTETNSLGSYIFRIHDSLLNLGPMNDVCFGVDSSPENYGSDKSSDSNSEHVKIVISSGRAKGGSISVLGREIEPKRLKTAALANARDLWSIHARRPPPKELGIQEMEAAFAADAEYDQFLIVSKAGNSDGEDTAVYKVTGNSIEETAEGDFERDGLTVGVGTLANGTSIVHLLKSEIRSYDSELGLTQILPMDDEETGADLHIIGSSFADPYLMVLRDDSSVIFLHADEKGGDMEQLDRPESFTSTKWLSGCVYKSSAVDDKAYAFLLTAEGSLRIYELPNLAKPAFVADGLAFLPNLLTSEWTSRRSSAKAAIVEILFADIGDSTVKSPYLLARTSNDDIEIYQPFHFPLRESPAQFTTNLRWLKVPQLKLAKYTEDPALELEDSSRESTLRAIANINGHSTVFQCGASPSFIIREASSSPKVLNLRGKIITGLTSFNTSDCDRGFAYLDAKNTLQICELPSETSLGSTGWVTRKIPLKQDVQGLCYHAQKDTFIVATNEKAEFALPEDSYHHEWAREDTNFKPLLDQSTLRLYHGSNWSLIDNFFLEPSEVILCMKLLNLEVSENTHERKPLIAVGTAIVRGEDLAAKGCIYILEVVTVVPEPSRPETNRKLRLVVKEEVKGAVTALSEIGSGFMLVTQGQKCMVRGLKEDGTLLPVAFMDLQCYVTVAKSFPGTGMVLMGDAEKGVWFTGYTEEPYKMIMFGKSRSNMEVVTADFLPSANQLYVIVADGDENIHTLHFDPEHPKSLSGTRLLHRSTFHVGHFPAKSILLPSTLSLTTSVLSNGISQTNGERMDIDNDSARQPLHHLLSSTQSGVLTLLTPLDEPTYRRLGALQTFLTSVLEHPCGLNPRAHRAVESEALGGRGVIDGTILARWKELSSQRRAEACAKLGVEEWVVRSDLEVVLGEGLGFL